LLFLDTTTTGKASGVIPAEAGIQAISAKNLDARQRGHDDVL